MKKSISAEKLLNQLEQDEAFLKRQREQDIKLEKIRAELSADEANLVSELNSLGYDLSSVWDLVNTSSEYNNAIPILTKHLDYDYEKKNIEGIVRALTVKSAKGIANKKLLKMFKSVQDDDLRWVIANALSIVADSQDEDELVKLLSENKYGSSRTGIIKALVNISKQKYVNTYMKLLDDETVAASCIDALRKLRVVEAKKKIEKLLQSEDYAIRQSAKKAYQKL